MIVYIICSRSTVDGRVIVDEVISTIDIRDFIRVGHLLERTSFFPERIVESIDTKY